MARSKRHIAISAATFSGNQGAAAMLHATIQQLNARNFDIEFSVFTVYPLGDLPINNYTNATTYPANPKELVLKLVPLAFMYRFLPFTRQKIKQFHPGLAALSRCELQIDLAGISFADGRGVFVLYNIASILPALILKVPVVKFAQAMGPFEDLWVKAMARIVLPLVDKVYARGKVTYEALKMLKLKNLEHSSDIAFLFKHTAHEETSAQKVLDDFGLKKGSFLLFAPSQVLYEKCEKEGLDYVEICVDFIQWVHEVHNIPVLIIAHSVREHTTKTHNNDLPVCKLIYKKLPTGSDCFMPNEVLYAGELKSLIKFAKAVVTARFHAMISSLSQSVPTAVTGWSHKYEEVLSQLDVDLPTVYVDQDFAQNTKKATDQILKLNKKNYDSLMSASLEEVKKRAERQIDYVTKKYLS